MEYINLKVHRHEHGDTQFVELIVKLLSELQTNDKNVHGTPESLRDGWHGDNVIRFLVQKETGLLIKELYQRHLKLMSEKIAEGKKEGSNLLFSLNNGDLTMDDFNRRVGG